MKRKIFSMTDRHIEILQKESKVYQISEAEVLRKIIDFYNENHVNPKGIQIQTKSNTRAKE